MALIAQLGEHCTGIAEVVCSSPAQSLKIFSGLCSSGVTAALALMTVITQLLLMDKINSTLHYTWAKYNVHIIKGNPHTIALMWF